MCFHHCECNIDQYVEVLPLNVISLAKLEITRPTLRPLLIQLVPLILLASFCTMSKESTSPVSVSGGRLKLALEGQIHEAGPIASSQKLAASWSYSCFSKGRGTSESNIGIVQSHPPNSRGILKRCWKQTVTGSNPARSLGNLYSAYQNPIMFPGSHEPYIAFIHPPWASSERTEKHVPTPRHQKAR